MTVLEYLALWAAVLLLADGVLLLLWSKKQDWDRRNSIKGVDEDEDYDI